MFQGDQIRGILTGFHLDKEVSSGLASRLQICIDGVDSDATLKALAAGLLEEADNACLVHIFTWSLLELPELSALGFRRRQLKGSVRAVLFELYDKYIGAATTRSGAPGIARLASETPIPVAAE